MMLTKSSKQSILAQTFLATLALCAAACSSPELGDTNWMCQASSDCLEGHTCGNNGYCEAPGKCEGQLKVKITTDNNGPTADVAPPYNAGITDYLSELNETQGGIRGCRIHWDIRDTAYDPAKTSTQVKNWQKESDWSEVNTVFVFGTGPTLAVAEMLGKDKKVVIPGSYAGSLACPTKVNKDVSYTEVNSNGDEITTNETKSSPGYPYVFFPVTDYSTAIRIGIQAMWKIAPGRVAMAHGDAASCAYCVDPLAAGKSYVKSLPQMRLGRDLIIPQTSDPAKKAEVDKAVADFVQKEIDRKKLDSSYEPVSWFWIGNTIFSASLLGEAVADAQKMIDLEFSGTQDHWKLKVMANNWGIGETLLKQDASSYCDSCGGIFYGIFPVPRYGDLQFSSAMTELIQIHDKYRKKSKGQSTDDYQDVRYVQGYVSAMMWARGVEKALSKGGTNVTGEQLKAALETLKEESLDGLTAGPIGFTGKDHRPQSKASVYRVSDNNKNLVFVDRFSIALQDEWLGY